MNIMTTLAGTPALGLGQTIANCANNKDNVKKGVEHLGNFQKAKMQTGVATVGVGVATYVGLKSSAVNRAALKVINKVKNTKIFKSLAPELSKVANKFKALPASGKLIVGAGVAAGAVILGKINDKFQQNYGKIEQKYEDKAELREKISEEL